MTRKEIEEKWNRMPIEEKRELLKEFGILAKPLWILLAEKQGFTKAGKKL